jgi:hypothetical protein
MDLQVTKLAVSAAVHTGADMHECTIVDRFFCSFAFAPAQLDVLARDEPSADGRRVDALTQR